LNAQHLTIVDQQPQQRDHDGDRFSRSQRCDLSRNDELIRNSLVGKRSQQRRELTAQHRHAPLGLETIRKAIVSPSPLEVKGKSSLKTSDSRVSIEVPDIVRQVSTTDWWSQALTRWSEDRSFAASASSPAMATATRAGPPNCFLKSASVAAATVATTALMEPTPISSNAIIMYRRQIAEPFSAKSVFAARLAISVSPRRMAFCKRLVSTHGSAGIGSRLEGSPWSKLQGKLLLCLRKCSGHDVSNILSV
jgi:hypothetical protein